MDRLDTSGHPTKCISDFELRTGPVTCLVIHNEQSRTRKLYYFSQYTILEHNRH